MIGLCGVVARSANPGREGGLVTVWDPKEASELVMRPDHPVALKL